MKLMDCEWLQIPKIVFKIATETLQTKLIWVLVRKLRELLLIPKEIISNLAVLRVELRLEVNCEVAVMIGSNL